MVLKQHIKAIQVRQSKIWFAYYTELKNGNRTYKCLV